MKYSERQEGGNYDLDGYSGGLEDFDQDTLSDIRNRRNAFIKNHEYNSVAIGFITLIFPWCLLVCGLFHYNELLPSISEYYHTDLRSVFQVGLGAIILFLITYSNLGDKVNYKLKLGSLSIDEKWLYRIAGGSLFLVAFAPTQIGDSKIVEEFCPIEYYQLLSYYPPGLPVLPNLSMVHKGAAVIFFILISVLILFSFPKDIGFTKSTTKYRRIIQSIGVVLIIVLISLILRETNVIRLFPTFKQYVFFSEMIMLELFGIAWLLRIGWLKRLLRLVEK